MRNTFIVLMTVIFFFSMFTLFFDIESCTASGNTIYVDDSGGADYTVIQDAIDAAENGDTISVYSGTYSENIIIDKPITLNKAGSGNVIINGAGDHTVKITVNGVTVSGLIIKNNGGSDSCIFIDSVSNHVIIENTLKQGGNSIFLINSNSNTIEGNTIENNNIGIYLYNSDSNTIKSNYIQNNNANGVLLISSSTENTFYLNHFSDNIAGNAQDETNNGNSWSNSGTSQGNYWDDYNDYDSNSDGIGDSSYVIDTNSKDDYPLGVFLNQNPIASISSITPNPAFQGETVYFYGDWSDDGSIIEWEWKSDKNGVFGYGKNSQSSSLSLGTHSISFRIKDNNGVWSSYVYQTLIIEAQSSQNQKPSADIVTIEPGSAIYGNEIYFHGVGQDTDGYISNYQWRSSLDGVISSISTFTKSDLSKGSHTIYFKVQDEDGEWSNEDTATLEITVEPTPNNNPPVADPGGPYTSYTNNTITFDASNSYDVDSGDTINTYHWDFGDGNTGTGITQTHTFSIAQEYTITLTVTDNHGSTNTVTTTANIASNPNNNGDNGNNGDIGEKVDEVDSSDKTKGIPGFEMLLFLICIATTLFLKRKF